MAIIGGMSYRRKGANLLGMYRNYDAPYNTASDYKTKWIEFPREIDKLTIKMGELRG